MKSLGNTARRFLFLCLVSLLAMALSACGGESSNTGDEDVMAEVDLGGDDDATADIDVGEMTIAPVDSDWMPGEQDEDCKVCKSCASSADCSSGQLCWQSAGGGVCTEICSAGSCPGNSRCFDVTNPETNRTTSLCLNGEAHSQVCPLTYTCAPPVDPNMDMEMDMEELPSICPTGGLACVYCGDATGWEGECPESNTTPQCQVFRITNMERAAMGLPILRYDGQLAAAAQLHAIEMSTCDYFEHDALDGRDPFDRIEDQGYSFSTAGENIAVGQQSSTRVMDDWMNSPGHRANILQPSFTELGVGYYEGYWVQNFGTPN